MDSAFTAGTSDIMPMIHFIFFITPQTKPNPYWQNNIGHHKTDRPNHQCYPKYPFIPPLHLFTKRCQPGISGTTAGRTPH